MRGIKPLTKLRRQVLSQRGQQALTIDGAGLASLLEFDEVPTQLPAGLHLHHVHRLHGALVGLLDDLAQAGQQVGETSIGRWGLRGGVVHAASRRSIWPVTAAVMRAERRSLRRVMLSWVFSVTLVILSVLSLMNSAIDICSFIGGIGIFSDLI